MVGAGTDAVAATAAGAAVEPVLVVGAGTLADAETVVGATAEPD